MDFKEINWNGVDKINPAGYRDQELAVVYMVMNHRFI